MIFLRPWWLLALLVPFLFLLFHKKIAHKNPWRKYFDPILLRAVEIKKHISTHNTFFILPLIIWILWSIAMAGPTWYKLPVPASSHHPNTVIVMDLNPDFSPEIIQKLQMRLYDILTLLKGERVGLVLYGKEQGYVAMPLTPDLQLIQMLGPNLIPQVLPDISVNKKAGIRKAEDLLTNSTHIGRILFLSPDQTIPKSAKYQTLHINLQNDLMTILEQKNIPDSMDTPTWDQTMNVWADMGIWFILLSIPLCALLFRKNLFFMIVFCYMSLSAQADFFARPDQIAYHQETKGVQAYQQQDFSTAEQLFQSPYNRGNALAHQGKIEQAISAYKQALELNPDDLDAKFNKEYLEKQLSSEQQPNPQEENTPNQTEPQSSDNNSESQTDDQNNHSETSNQPNNQNDKETTKDKNSNESQNTSPSEPTQDQTQQELEQALAEQPTTDTFNQQEQQILNRLNRDPARVLRYRLNLQHQMKG